MSPSTSLERTRERAKLKRRVELAKRLIGAFAIGPDFLHTAFTLLSPHARRSRQGSPMPNSNYAFERTAIRRRNRGPHGAASQRER